MAVSKFTVKLEGKDSPPAGCMSGDLSVTSTETISAVADGNADNQIQVVYCKDSEFDGDIAASGSLAIDLETDLDRFGDALGLADVAMLYVKTKVLNDGAGTASGVLQLRPAAAAAWDQLIKAVPGGTDTPAIEMPPGAFIVVGGFLAGTYPVTPTTAKALTLVEVGAANATGYKLQIWGRRP